jgi:hypothetical protein
MTITVTTDAVTAETVTVFAIIFTMLALAATILAATKQEIALSIVFGLITLALVAGTRFSIRLMKSVKATANA